MSGFGNTDKAFEFFLNHEHNTQAFTLVELSEATGWKLTTVVTYLRKKWANLISTSDGTNYQAVGVEALGKHGFRDLQTQVARPGPSVSTHVEPSDDFEYQVALSFAGEDRVYVEQVANYLRGYQVSVFYDKYEEPDLWGKDLYEHLRDVYQDRAKYCVMFVSKHYATKLWATHERKSALGRAFKEKGEYILPARFDDTEISGLSSTVSYIDLREKSPENLGAIILEKLGVNLDIEAMIEELRNSLSEYEIEIDGEKVIFIWEDEQFRAEYPVSILLHMHREGWLDAMFLMTGLLLE